MDVAEIVGFDPEQAVLVAALRGQDLPPIADELRLAAVTSWQRLGGVLALTLARQGHGSVDLHEHVASATSATAARWQDLRSRLAGLVVAWSSEGIDVTLLKGAALVEGGVVGPAQRPMADLDVLVADRAERAHAIAIEHGFTTVADARTWDHARTRHHHLPALTDDDGTMLEVHHRLLDGSHPLRRLDDAVRGRTVALAGMAASTPDPLALWLHLAVHFWDDRRRGTGGALLQLRDLHLLLPEVDRSQLVATSLDTASAPLVRAVAAVLEELLPSPPAADLRRDLAGPRPDDEWVAAFVRRRVLGRRSPLPQLVHPTFDVPYTPWRLVTRLRHQLTPSRRNLERVLGPDARRRQHLSGLLPVLRDAAVAPRTTVRDMRLDRWAHEVERACRP